MEDAEEAFEVFEAGFGFVGEVGEVALEAFGYDDHEGDGVVDGHFGHVTVGVQEHVAADDAVGVDEAAVVVAEGGVVDFEVQTFGAWEGNLFDGGLIREIFEPFVNAALVLIGDVGKGAAAAAAGAAIGGRAVGVGCALAAVVGHVAPVTRRFRGGKGVATLTGAAIVLLPVPMLGLAAAWAIVAKITGTASLGSLVVAAGLPIGAAIVGRPVGEVAAFAAAGVLVAVRHRDNIDRLRRGEEASLSE